MKRVGFIALALGLLGLASCAGNSGPNPVVLMDTSMGQVKIELFQDKAPITVENFLRYVDEKHYDGTIFHRVISDFMIQGGGMLPGMKEKGAKHDPITNEARNGLSNVRGTIAMARTGDPNSATDQFFINVLNNGGRGLDRGSGEQYGYAVFGKVIEGMDVVDKIRYVQTQVVAGQQDVPVEDVIIKSVRRVEPQS